ncbi:MAG: hypothetical protein WDN46_09155 [Methylocella sp.]
MNHGKILARIPQTPNSSPRPSAAVDRALHLSQAAFANCSIHNAKKREEPKLCPAPEPHKPGRRKLFDVQYEQFVRSIADPQRQPPLPAALAFSLMDPSTGKPVFFDDCRESDGAMIEAKGHYAEMMRSEWGQDILADRWAKQAEDQIVASGRRRIEWYFHEQAAADLARRVFQREANLKRIKVRYRPDPVGAPNPNLRIK